MDRNGLSVSPLCRVKINVKLIAFKLPSVAEMTSRGGAVTENGKRVVTERMEQRERERER